MKLYTLEDDLILNNSLEINLSFSVLGVVVSLDDSTTFTTVLETETIQADINWIVNCLEISLCDKSTFSVLKQLIDVAKIFSN